MKMKLINQKHLKMKMKIENQFQNENENQNLKSKFLFLSHFLNILYHFEMKIVNKNYFSDPREEKLKIKISVRDSVLKIDRTILKAQNRSHFVRSLLRTLDKI